MLTVLEHRRASGVSRASRACSFDLRVITANPDFRPGTASEDKGIPSPGCCLNYLIHRRESTRSSNGRNAPGTKFTRGADARTSDRDVRSEKSGTAARLYWRGGERDEEGLWAYNTPPHVIRPLPCHHSISSSKNARCCGVPLRMTIPSNGEDITPPPFYEERSMENVHGVPSARGPA